MSLLITPPRTTETAGGPWPATARFGADGHAEVGGVDLMEVAGRFGTPAYVMDEADVRLRCRAYRAALPRAEVAYAAKAFWCRAMAAWVRSEGLALDVCSASAASSSTTSPRSTASPRSSPPECGRRCWCG
ncbi:hypothetical protein ABZ860_21815 [Microbispora sp. NPDC046973]|uniref:hypothetical protein n=1 Tax=Microbispora sp. NPDC046973 TaxID=3155022 RepID=UPI0033D8BB7B